MCKTFMYQNADESPVFPNLVTRQEPKKDLLDFRGLQMVTSPELAQTCNSMEASQAVLFDSNKASVPVLLIFILRCVMDQLSQGLSSVQMSTIVLPSLHSRTCAITCENKSELDIRTQTSPRQNPTEKAVLWKQTIHQLSFRQKSTAHS